MNAFLALDIGTSSTRARLYRADDLAPVPGAAWQIGHDPRVTPDGGATLDPDALVEETILCCRAALDAAPAGTRVLGVGASCFWHSIVGMDARGNATTPVLLWSDRRSAAQAARLRAALPDAPDRTGCPWHTSYVPPRLAWLAETDPDAFAASTRFASPAAYLLARLFGAEHAVESASMASASGLWDQTRQAWDTAVAAAVGVDPARFLPVRDQPRAGLAAPVAARLPELADVPWLPAIGDGAASNLGSGAAAPGRVALMIGTSGAMRTVAPGTTPPHREGGLWRYQIGPERFALGGALTNGGSVWAWLEKTLRLSDDDAATIAAMPPDSHGLGVLPFLAGERAPLWRDDLASALVGFTAATTPAHIARASLEAVAYRFAAVRERLRPVAPTATLVGTGAALLASPAWQQILADVLGEALDVSAEEEGSARGAALWARERLGMGPAADAPVPAIVAHREPDPSVADVYARARQRHEELFALVNG